MATKVKGKIPTKRGEAQPPSAKPNEGGSGGSVHVFTVWHPGVSPNTYEQHRDILSGAETSQVWWAAIHDPEYPEAYRFVLDKYLPRLEAQIRNGKDTYLFVGALDPMREFLWGKIEEIRKGSEFAAWLEDERVPRYYRELAKQRPDLNPDYWFLLSDLRHIPHSVFKKVRPIGFEEIDGERYGKARRPYPCACDFDGEKELMEALDLSSIGSNRERRPTGQVESLGNDEIRISRENRTVNLMGKYFFLTPLQIKVVILLWEAYENGNPALNQQSILNKLTEGPAHADHGPESLKDIFRSTPGVMGELIIRAKRGLYRLNLELPA